MSRLLTFLLMATLLAGCVVIPAHGGYGHHYSHYYGGGYHGGPTYWQHGR